VGGRDVMMYCPHVFEAGHVGAIGLTVAKPERVRIGEAIPLGGSDPVVLLGVASSSVREGELIQDIPGGESGAVIFEEFEVGRVLRGRFLGAGFRTGPSPPTHGCRISDAEFVADWGPGVRGR
jgi:hypothetical protein